MPWDKFFFIQVFDNLGRNAGQYTKTLRKTFGHYCAGCYNGTRTKCYACSHNAVHPNPRIITDDYRGLIIFTLIV